MPRYIAPLSVLLLSCALPFAASASTGTRTLCLNAERAPATFLRHPDFASRILKMSTSCPELAIALTNTITGSIAGVTDHGSDKTRKNGPDYSDLLDRLKVATRNLDVATANVAKAQTALDRTIRRAKQAGLSEADLQALYAMEGEGSKRVLPDYTAGKRKALENYVTARDRLATAEKKLDQANERAEPLVEKALELAGKANVAQKDLANVLDGLTAAERQAMLDKTLSDATQSVVDLEARITAAEAAFDQASKALKSALNHKPYTKALREYEEQQAVHARAAEDLAKADAKFAAAEAKLRDMLAEDSHCTGNACRGAKRDALRAAGQLAVAKVDLGHQTRDLEQAQKDLEKLERALDLGGLSDAYNEQAATLAATQAAEVLARDLAASTSRQAKELADLLSSAADALTKADAASAEAKAATAAEEGEVAAARAALEEAIANVQIALDGSAEEMAALHAVHDAKVVLQEALNALGAAQVTADALTADVAAIQDAPAEVTKASEALETSAESGEVAAKAAEDARHDAAAAINDYHAAENELRDATEAETPAEDTAEAESEAPADNASSAPEADSAPEEKAADAGAESGSTDAGSDDNVSDAGTEGGQENAGPEGANS